MWVLWTLVIVAFSVWLGHTWIVALRNKYQHTLESRLVLFVIALVSWVLARQIALQVAPQLGMLPITVISTALAFGPFCLLSFIAVNMWLAALTRPYDEKIWNLEEEEDRLIRELEALRWKALSAPLDAEPDRKQAGSPDDPDDEIAKLNKIVLDWEQAGGAARVRSLKVLEWKEEISAKGDAELRSETERLWKTVEAEADEGRQEQARARWALCRAELMVRESRVRRESIPRETRKDDKPQIASDQMAMRQRLQDILREMQAVRAEKAEFLQKKIRLTWRRGP